MRFETKVDRNSCFFAYIHPDGTVTASTGHFTDRMQTPQDVWTWLRETHDYRAKQLESPDRTARDIVRDSTEEDFNCIEEFLKCAKSEPLAMYCIYRGEAHWDVGLCADLK